MTDHSGLPQLLADIADVAGIDAAWALARAKGGATVYIPRKVGQRHWLARIVGYEAANAICAHFAGARGVELLIPMGTPAQKAARLREALGAGLSTNDTALQAGVHKRTVYRHRKREPGLFDSDQ